MRIKIPENYHRIADIGLIPESPTTGALSVFSRIFTSVNDICTSGQWNLIELLGSIPDLQDTFLNCYIDGIPATLPLDVVKVEERFVDRIRLEDIIRFADFGEISHRIPNFSTNYLIPQRISTHIILNRKMSFVDPSIFSLSGQRYLQLGCSKNGNLYVLHLLIIIFMILYALSVISRYNPEKWNPFVRKDTTGEKLIIESFLDYARRVFPNLVIDNFFGYNHRFVHKIKEYTVIDPVSKKEIFEMIEKQVYNAIEKR